MSSDAASAVYPHLAKAERQGELRDRSDAKPEWGRSNHPLWDQVRPLPNLHDPVMVEMMGKAGFKYLGRK